jgi:hypothetical protein
MKKQKLNSITLITLLALSMALIFPLQISPANAIPPTAVVVDPSYVANVTTFSVTVKMTTIPDPGFYGWEFYLFYSKDVLRATGETVHIPAPWLPDKYSGPFGDGINNDYNTTHGRYWRALSGKAPGLALTGDWDMATIDFEYIGTPPFHGVDASDLILTPAVGSNYMLITKAADDIPHDIGNGLFEYYWKSPTELPYLEVVPADYVASAVGEVFNIYVYIRNLDASWALMGIEFKLGFNATIVEALDVTEGPFLPSFAGVNGTVFVGLIKPQYVHVADALLGIPPTFPSGEGMVANITMRAKYQPVFPETSSCLLHLYDVVFADVAAEDIPQGSHLDGSYRILQKVLGRRIDIWTDLGGQGPNEPSDHYMPQWLVVIYIELTYNEDPIQYKPVAIEVEGPRNPYENITITRTVFTDSMGLASTEFRIPWPCLPWTPAEAEDIVFGEWNVIGTAEVAEVVVNDTLTFKVGWLFEIMSITPKKSQVVKCHEPIEFTLTYKVFTAHLRDVLVTVVIYDELGVPVGKWSIWLHVQTAKICVEETFDINVTIPCVKWTYVGVAHAYADAYTEWPQNDGTPWCPEKECEFGIVKYIPPIP